MCFKSFICLSKWRWCTLSVEWILFTYFIVFKSTNGDVCIIDRLDTVHLFERVANSVAAEAQKVAYFRSNPNRR